MPDHAWNPDLHYCLNEMRMSHLWISGYETVPPRPPLPRMNQYHDPPYARLENSKDEEMLSEEGYETIPGSERQNRNGNEIWIYIFYVHMSFPESSWQEWRNGGAWRQVLLYFWGGGSYVMPPLFDNFYHAFQDTN